MTHQKGKLDSQTPWIHIHELHFVIASDRPSLLKLLQGICALIFLLILRMIPISVEASSPVVNF